MPELQVRALLARAKHTNTHSLARPQRNRRKPGRLGPKRPASDPTSSFYKNFQERLEAGFQLVNTSRISRSNIWVFHQSTGFHKISFYPVKTTAQQSVRVCVCVDKDTQQRVRRERMNNALNTSQVVLAVTSQLPSALPVNPARHY